MSAELPCLVWLALLIASNGVQASSFAVHPEDVSVAMGKTLPLACAASTAGEVVWERSNGSTEGLLVENTPYTASTGQSYQIGTLLLCNIGFEEAGVYVCINSEDNSRESVNVDVHTSSIAYFQLQLTGVQNCAQWLLDDATRATKTEELSTLIMGQALNDVCSTATSSSCLITEQFFDCNEEQTANSVTFRARLEHRSADPAVTANVSPLIGQIESWAMQTSAITLNNQRLRFITSCPVRISDASDGYCPALVVASGLSADSDTVLGATIGTVVGVCVLTIIIVLLMQLICWKAMKSNNKASRAEVVHYRNAATTNQTGEDSRTSQYIDMAEAPHYDHVRTPSAMATKAADLKKAEAIGETLTEKEDTYYY